jgi:hypothetical protein
MMKGAKAILTGFAAAMLIVASSVSQTAQDGDKAQDSDEIGQICDPIIWWMPEEGAMSDLRVAWILARGVPRERSGLRSEQWVATNENSGEESTDRSNNCWYVETWGRIRELTI